MSNSKSSTANKKAVTIKVTKSAEIKKAEKANKAALAKAKKEKAESIAADKAVEQTSEHLKEAQTKSTDKDFSELTKAVYGKTWRKERLIAFVEENHKDVKILEYSRRQIAFTISNTRVPKDGYFSVR